MTNRAAGSLLAALTALLMACGGGSDTAAPGAPQPPAALAVLATGSSAHDVSLGWSAVADSQAVTIDRRAAGVDAPWARIAELPGHSRHFVDDGLAPQTRYRYRITARLGGGGSVSAESEASTDSVAPVATALAAAVAHIGGGVVGAAGGRVAAADGSASVEVPAGAFAQDTALRLFTATNTAPDGVGSGLRIEADTRPQRPLRVTLPGGAGPDDGGEALAVQRADGSWLSLPPLPAADNTSRAAELAAPTLGAAASAGSARAQAADGVVVSWNVVRYLSWRLVPASATLRVGSSREVVPVARVLANQVFCDVDDELLCVPSPVLEARELPILNDKPGYRREWRVQGIVGGSAATGTVAPRAGAAGASYTAPQRAPGVNPVTLSFHTLHIASGRAMRLAASLQITEPTWDGHTRGYLGPGDIAFWFGSAATWRLVDSSGGVERFEATGLQRLEVEDISCTGSASPASASLPPGTLVVDRSVQPARYTLDLGSPWATTITGTCPGQGSASVPMTVPGRLVVDGLLSGNGRRIEGETVVGGVRWDWFFTAP